MWFKRNRQQVLINDRVGLHPKVYTLRYGDTVTVAPSQEGYGIRGLTIRLDGPNLITLLPPESQVKSGR